MARTKQTARQNTAGISGKSPRNQLGNTAARKSAPARKAPKQKRSHRHKPGTVTLRNIRKYQKSTEPLLMKAPFARLTREVAEQFKGDLKFSKEALFGLQQMTEENMVKELEGSYLISINRNAITLQPKDMQTEQTIVNKYS